MSEETRAGEPAMTKEEWEHGGTEEGNVYSTSNAELVVWDCALGDRALVQRRHALAALCLHGQPYGMTWEDVDFLRRLCTDAPSVIRKPGLALADRIAALLPPRP